MIGCVAVEGYRSLRSVYVPLARLTVVTGANGSGKSSLYRVLSLLAAAARGELVAALAREGGLSSTLWAGPERISTAMRSGENPIQGTRRTGPVALRIGFSGDDLGYAVDLGLPPPSSSRFGQDPQIKTEAIWHGPRLRPTSLLTDRHGGVVRCRRDDGSWDTLELRLPLLDSMLAEVADPRSAPEVLAVRENVRSWRFYDQIRTDPRSPVRTPVIGTRTVALASDGHDLAAALATIDEIGDSDQMAGAVDAAFPGSRIEIEDRDGFFHLLLHQRGLLRPLAATELSDGTLRFLVWVAALLSSRPPELLVLNEPDNSLHPDLLPALARLVVAAATKTQVMCVSHNALFVQEIRRSADATGSSLREVRLVKDTGETHVQGEGTLNGGPWNWPKR